MREVSSIVVLVLSACGSPRPATPTGDGAVTDSDEIQGDVATDQTPDALPDIPASYECDINLPGTVRVRTAIANEPVVIHDVFGSFVSRTTSGPTRIVDVTVPGCGMVTAVTPGIYHTITYVRDGDELWIDVHPDQGLHSTDIGTGRLYIDTPVAGAPSYYILGPLSSSLVANDPSARDLSFSAASVDAQGNATFVVHPHDNASGGPAIDTFCVFEDVSVASVMQTPLHLSAWTTGAAAVETVQLQVQFAQPMELAGFTLGSWWNNRSHWQQYTGPTSSETTHDVALDVSSYGDGLVVTIPFRETGNGNLHGYTEVIPFPQALVALDLSDDELPEIAAVNVTASALRPTLTWDLQGGSVSPDIIDLRVFGTVDWRFAVPPGLSTFKLPEMPNDLAANFTTMNYGLTLHEASDYSGYAEARARFLEQFIGPRMQPMGFVLRATYFGIAL